jgi:hypothetical protein
MGGGCVGGISVPFHEWDRRAAAPTAAAAVGHRMGRIASPRCAAAQPGPVSGAGLLSKGSGNCGCRASRLKAPRLVNRRSGCAPGRRFVSQTHQATLLPLVPQPQ